MQITLISIHQALSTIGTFLNKTPDDIRILFEIQNLKVGSVQTFNRL